MVPDKLKAMAHYFKIANEHQTRDPAVYYWCMMYVVQNAMKIDKDSKECKEFIVHSLDALERTKKAHPDVEAITNEVVGQAHVEEAALKFFMWADTQDRNSNFDKNVVKAFYTAGHLFDVLTVFSGAVDEENQMRMKYSKWKAANIHTCLKNGETPIPGPQGGDASLGFDVPGPGAGGSGGASPGGARTPSPARKATPPPDDAAARARSDSAGSGNGGSSANFKTIEKAQKHCKFAISALDYEDVTTAVKELNLALQLLDK